MVRRSSFFYPNFSDDLALEGLKHSILQSIAYLEKVPSDRVFHFGKDHFDTAHMVLSLSYFLDYIQSKPSTRDLKKFIRSNYLVYQSIGRDGNGEVLFTGYYEPHLRGSLEPSEEYRVPIYSLPADLIKINLSAFNEKYKGETIIGRYTGETVLPYYDRQEIDYKGVLEGKVEPVAWVNDPVDVFFLQIQGSGKIFLNNGGMDGLTAALVSF
jgi:membrane-bound lytic murein transglycosylase A